MLQKIKQVFVLIYKKHIKAMTSMKILLFREELNKISKKNMN